MSAILLAGLLVAAAQPAPATGPPRLSGLRISGNDALADGDVRAATGLVRGALLTDSSIASAIAGVTRLYHSRSFYGAIVSGALMNFSADSGEADCSITVREGFRATLGRVSLRGASAMTPETAAGLIPLSTGEPLDRAAIEAGVAAILGWYDRAGYPFAQAAVSGIDDGGEGSMTVTIDVAEGGLTTIAGIRVAGNTETADRVILREARMDIPSVYDPAAVDRFAGRLRRLGIFADVQDPSLYRLTGEGNEPAPEEGAPGDGEYGLLVTVAEGRTSSFDGVLGYAPEQTASSGGSLTGSVVLAFRNLFGTARRLDAAWMRPGRNTQEVRLGYEEPWAFGYPVNLAGGFSQRRQDSSYVDTRWRLSAEFLATASLSVSAIVEGQSVVPSSGPSGAGIEDATATTGGAVVRYDTRDDRELPRSGVDFRSEYRSGNKRRSAVQSGKSAIRHIGFDFDFFIPLTTRQVLAFAAHGREVSTDTPDPGDLYRLGGFRTLRGFREDQFLGERTAWGTAEYRFLAGGKSFLYGFVDQGYVMEAGGGGDLYTYGYGVGLRLETGLGLVGVAFALGKGDPVSQTKIHFGLINDF